MVVFTDELLLMYICKLVYKYTDWRKQKLYIRRRYLSVHVLFMSTYSLKETNAA